MSTKTDELMTVAEVAALLRLKPKTVYAMIRDGRLPAIRVTKGRNGIRISQRMLHEHLRRAIV